MKKFLLCTFATLMLVSIIPTPVIASSPMNTQPAAPAGESAQQIARLNEIESMDKSEMTFQEKKELREETWSIKSSLHDGGYGGIYISVGALIIIILILIILL